MTDRDDHDAAVWVITMRGMCTNTSPETFTFGSNAWFATDQAAWSGPALGSGIPAESGSLVQREPTLVDRAGGNYRPLAASPLLGAARALDFALPPDFDNRCHQRPRRHRRVCRALSRCGLQSKALVREIEARQDPRRVQSVARRAMISPTRVDNVREP